MYNLEYLLTYLFNYLFIYNLNMVCFVTLILLFTDSLKFLNNLIILNYSNWIKQCLLILIFSFAGIPPFLFFFYKLNIVYFLFSIELKWVLFLYLLLFVGLVFYLQIVRYLMWINPTKLKIFPIGLLYVNYVNLLFTIIIILINSFGLVLLDDLLIIFLFVSD